MLRRQGAVVFIDEKAKVNAKYYEESLLPSLLSPTRVAFVYNGPKGMELAPNPHYNIIVDQIL